MAMGNFNSKQYTMDEAVSVANNATHDIVNYLQSKKGIVSVINVENDRRFMVKDIDLLVVYLDKNLETVVSKIEIKGDRYHHTGNYFFETISNTSKMTPGCFMYTEADYLFYYFVNVKELHIIPVKEARLWFTTNFSLLQDKTVTTSVNGSHYNTLGKLVPITTIQSSVKVKVIKL